MNWNQVAEGAKGAKAKGAAAKKRKLKRMREWEEKQVLNAEAERLKWEGKPTKQHRHTLAMAAFWVDATKEGEETGNHRVPQD